MTRTETTEDDPEIPSTTFTVDLHTHTRFFHHFEGRPTPFDPVGVRLLGLFGRRGGLDGVALTNHNYYTEFDGAVERPRLIPGIEVTSTAGHILVVGPDPPSRTVPGELTPDEVVSIAHDRGCAAIIPHPFRRSTVSETAADFDAVEINGKHFDRLERVRDLAETMDLPVVGGSDAHYPFEAGRAFTLIEATKLTPETVVEAIRDGRVEPVIRDRHRDRIMQTGYGFVHRYL